MIKNMKIKKSLILGFGVTIAISVIIIVASLILMRMQKNEYTRILEHHVESNQLTNQCRINYNVAGRRLRDAVLSGDMTSLQAAEEKIDELPSLIAELEKVYPLSNKTELNNFVSVVENWMVTAKEIANVARTDRNAASQMIVDDCNPQLAQAANAGQAMAAVLEKEGDDIIARRKPTSSIAVSNIVDSMIDSTGIFLR